MPPRFAPHFIAALIATLAMPANATVDKRSAPILEHLVQATGGSSARENEQTLHLEGRIETSGLRGHWEMWLGAPDRWVRSMTLGALRIREGFDGRVAWRTDLADKHVTLLSAAEIARARDDGWFYNERWALADQGGGTVRATSTSYIQGKAYDRLEITPPDGPPRHMLVNSQTGFIERITSQADHHTNVDLPSAYKILGGRKRPSVYGPPKDPLGDRPIERMTVDSVHVNVPIDSSHFSPPAVKDRAIAWRRTAGSIKVPFSYSSKSVIVKVAIDGKAPEDFILDTGASLTILDADYAYSQDMRGEGEAGVEGIAASADMRLSRVSSIALVKGAAAAVTLRDFRVGLLDLAEGSEMMLWRKPAGILGADFLSRFVVEIDYDARTVTLHDPKSFEHAGQGTAIPFELHGGIPVIDMTVEDGCTGKFMVDVGNSFQFLLHGSLVRSCKMEVRKNRREVDVVGGGIGGWFVSKMCRLDSVRIGPYAWTEPVAVLTLANRGGIGSKEVHGNIGNSVLERFRCTFDYARQQLWLEPGRRYGERERASRFGALFARLGSRVVAGNVLTGSAAYEAGLRWYDTIVAIDGRQLDRWTREEVDRLLEEGEVGKVLRVTYKRFKDDPETTVELTLKDVL